MTAFKIQAFSNTCSSSLSVIEYFNTNNVKDTTMELFPFDTDRKLLPKSKLTTMPRIFFEGELVFDAASFFETLEYIHQSPTFKGIDDIKKLILYPPSSNKKLLRLVKHMMRLPPPPTTY